MKSSHTSTRRVSDIDRRSIFGVGSDLSRIYTYIIAFGTLDLVSVSVSDGMQFNWGDLALSKRPEE